MSERLGFAARREHRRLSRSPGMPPATGSPVTRMRDVPVTADDGATLLTDHWFSEDAGGDTLLIRTPYGRDGAAGVAAFIAERGHHVAVQSCRGTFGSDGVFSPLHDEVADGQATMRWLRAQDWATGRVHSWGGSYFGVTQWAYCDGPERPDAMGIAISARRFDDAILYPGGGFSIDTPLTWAYALGIQERAFPARILALRRARRSVARGSIAVPPADAVRAALGSDAPFFRDWVAHSDHGDPWWEPLHFASDLATIPPVTLMAGWQDLFLVGQLDDYAALRAAGRPVRLVVGDWIHGAAETTVLGVRGALEAFQGGDDASGVLIEVSGGGGWRELDSWPPAAEIRAVELTADHRLCPVQAGRPSASLSYRYDPADPTPDAGGRTLNPFSAGRRDQRARERRDDVLVFTGEAFASDTIVAGTPQIELSLSSTNPRVDLFVRLCEVDARGRSRTVTDGYRRMYADAGAAGIRRVGLPLAPIAHRFAAGSRLRVQISSGAHPLHLRNPGTDDPVRDHSRLIASEQTVLLGAGAPAVLRLPVLQEPPTPAVHPAVSR